MPQKGEQQVPAEHTAAPFHTIFLVHLDFTSKWLLRIRSWDRMSHEFDEPAKGVKSAILRASFTAHRFLADILHRLRTFGEHGEFWPRHPFREISSALQRI